MCVYAVTLNCPSARGKSPITKVMDKIETSGVRWFYGLNEPITNQICSLDLWPFWYSKIQLKRSTYSGTGIIQHFSPLTVMPHYLFGNSGVWIVFWSPHIQVKASGLFSMSMLFSLGVGKVCCTTYFSVGLI